MRFGFVADVHAGNHRRLGGATRAGLNNRCRQTVNVYTAAVARAAALKCEGFYVLGDLFDTTDPSPQLIVALQQASKVKLVSTHLLVGNHDQNSVEAGDHALGPLAPVVISVIDAPRVNRYPDVELFEVPFRPGDAKDWLADTVKRMALKQDPSLPKLPRVLLLHLGIADERTPAFLRDSHDAVTIEYLRGVCLAFRISFVLAGNWHGRKFWEGEGTPKDPTILQLGALVPTGFDNPGWGGYGTLALIEINDEGELSLDWEELPGPRFLSAAGLTGLRKVLEACEGHADCHPYVLAKVGPDELVEAVNRIEKAKKTKLIVDGTVEPDRTEEKAAAKTAALAAASAETLDEAVRKYVEGVDFEGDRGLLLETVLGYLRSAA